MYNFLVSYKRKNWTASEEECFLCVWYNNLQALHSGKRRSEVYRDLQIEFRHQGINVTTAHIKAKIESFRRKYLHIKNENNPTIKWKYFGKVAAIMDYQASAKDVQCEPQLEDSLNGTFSSVYIDAVAALNFDEMDYSQKYKKDAPLARKPKRKRGRAVTLCSLNFSAPSEASGKMQKQKRRYWTVQEEEVFLGVWQKHLRDFRSDKKKSHVYKDMEIELHSLGIVIRCSDIKTKIESFTRRFRNVSNSTGVDAQWIHYSTVAELLGASKYDQCSVNSENSSYIRDTTSWFDEDGPIYPKTCMKVEETCLNSMYNGENTSENAAGHNNIFVAPQESIENNLKHTNPGRDEAHPEPPLINRNHTYLHNPNGLELNTRTDDFLGQLSAEQRMSLRLLNSSAQATCKSELTEQFGKFVTHELNMLSDDLLIEAKRRIYEIICVMQMKQLNQLNLNKTE